MKTPRVVLVCSVALAVGAGACIGDIGDPGGKPRVHPTGGLPPASAPMKYACTDPAARGAGNAVMRRLTKDELLQSMETLVGVTIMAAESVRQAATEIPPETTGDVVHEFQNGHAMEHVRGLLLTAEAVANEVAADAAKRDELLGTCAASADLACAQAFLDKLAARILKRPLDDARRQSLLDGFAAEGQGLTGMKQMLSRLLQAPEAVFHVEPAPSDCTAPSLPPPSVFGWDDSSVFFVPNGGPQTGPQQKLTEGGWYVWQVPASSVPNAYQRIVIDVAVTTPDGTPVQASVNLNDQSVVAETALAAGPGQLVATVDIAAKTDIKVGLYFANPGGGRVLEIQSMTLEATAGDAGTCTPAAPEGGRVAVDDYAVAARVAYALTGTAPDAELLEAAAQGQLGTLEQVRPHAERLLQSPEARRQLGAVLDAWLNLRAVPEPNPVIAKAAGIDGTGLSEEARDETLEYVAYQVLGKDAFVPALMTDRIGFPRSERLAKLYGTSVVTGDDPVPLENGHGGLLLRLAPLLSGQRSSSPILRGVYVRKRLLCDKLPSPDFSIIQKRAEELAASDPVKMSTREIVTEITSPALCQTCHVSINPIGFTLEGFGPLGLPRTEELVIGPDGAELARHAIVTKVTDPRLEPGGPDTLDGPEELNLALASTGKVYACIAERLYTHGRMRPAVVADDCALSEVEHALREGKSVKEAWIRAVVNEDLFWRKAEEAP